MSPTGRTPQPPALQPLPLRTVLAKKIREAFREEIPKPLVEVDYSELELRLLAGVQSPSGDP